MSSLDVVRANKFVSDNQNIDVVGLDIPVVGGHAGTTIIPLLSHVKDAKFTDNDIKEITHRVQFGGDEVVKAKNGGGSATLSMAYAGWTFAEKVLRAADGEEGIIVYTFVENDELNTKYLASKVELGRQGIAKVHQLPPMSEAETKALHAALPELNASIQKGIKFAQSHQGTK